MENYLFVLIAIGLTAIAAAIALEMKGRRTVTETSSALAELSKLNNQHREISRWLKPMEYRFIDHLNSKAKFDRYRLEDLVQRELEQHEIAFHSEIESRDKAIRDFDAYQRQSQRIAAQYLGKSSARGLSERRFRRIENRLFKKSQLQRPSSKAKILFGASYVSPQGRNRYYKEKELNLITLTRTLEAVRARTHSINQQDQIRLRERRLLTPKLRTDILHRDGYRCRSCGRDSAVVALHVDHIVPIACGGKTTVDNLQTLCQDCNLGKGALILN